MPRSISLAAKRRGSIIVPVDLLTVSSLVLAVLLFDAGYICMRKSQSKKAADGVAVPVDAYSAPSGTRSKRTGNGTNLESRKARTI
jgi:hypothetical protein